MPHSLFKSDYDIMTGKKIKKRKAFKTSTKRQALERANYRCEKCKTPLRKSPYKKFGVIVEFDHYKTRTSNSLNNCWVLCPICHREMTVVTKRKKKDILGTKHQTIVRSKEYLMKKGKKKVKKKKAKRKTKKPSLFPDFKMPKPPKLF